MTAPTEEVVLLDDAGHAIGSAPKAGVHHADTPLHLAFSCYVLDRERRLLVTRRALDKATFPGIWTNSFCGHPAPGEDLAAAVRRRGEQELGVTLLDLHVVLPAFRYQATMANGVRENELCPVFAAITDSVPAPDVSEVAATAWVPWEAFCDDVLSGAREVSVWCRLQVMELAERELVDGGFAPGSEQDLPPAVRRSDPRGAGRPEGGQAGPTRPT